MAKAIGRKLVEPDEKLDIEAISQRQQFTGVPCTFLVAGKCSIYADRPLVCRTLVNMDSVSLLCELVPGASVPVPYLNSTEFQGYFAYLTRTEQYADIREWFPAELLGATVQG
jgi:Fe-S-cluster containining protein